MRKILLLIFLALFLPFQANGTNCFLNNDETEPGCNSYNGCYFQPAEGMIEADCNECDSGTYNYTNSGHITECISCPTSYPDNGKIPNTTAQDYGQSECPWMCDNGYYRGGTGFDECIQCTGSLHCSGTGLEYSNSVPNGIYCTGNTQIVHNDTTHTYSCESCSDSNASLDGTVCKCKEGYYGTLNGLNTTCTACPAGTTTGAAGATTKSACHMTQNTKFCDANGENCMKLLSGANNINQ